VRFQHQNTKYFDAKSAEALFGFVTLFTKLEIAPQQTAQPLSLSQAENMKCYPKQ